MCHTPPTSHRLLAHHDRDLHALCGKITAVPRQIDNLVRHLHPLRHFTKHRILSIEKIRILDDNEELRTGTVGIIRPCHGENPSPVRNVVELGFELLARPSLTIGLRLVQIFGIGIASLDHESWNYSMKDRAVIETGFSQRDEIFNMFGSLLGKEDDVHIAKFRFERRLGTFYSFYCSCPRLVSRKEGAHPQ